MPEKKTAASVIDILGPRPKAIVTKSGQVISRSDYKDLTRTSKHSFSTAIDPTTPKKTSGKRRRKTIVTVTCPVCGSEVGKKNLQRHLTRIHSK